MLIKKAEHLDLVYINGQKDILLPHLHADGFLKELIVSDCKHVKYILNTEHWSSDMEFPSLHQLYLISLENLREICHGQLPSRFVNELDTLWLNNLRSLTYLWQDPTRCLTLSNLTVLKVEECSKLQYVVTQTMAKSLLNLKELVVKYCDGMKVIFLSEDVISREEDDIIIFPKLSSLCLTRLNDLEDFCSNFTGKQTFTLLSKQVSIKALETFSIEGIERMTRIRDSFQLDGNSFCQLKSLHLISCDSLVEVFPPHIISSLQSLEDVWIENCCSVEKLFGSDCFDVDTAMTQVLFPRLKNLNLLDLPKLMQILWLTTDHLSQVKVVFPVLESLHIQYLRCIKEICNNDIPAGSFSQLQTLHVTGCDKLLKVFPSQLIPRFNRLKEVFVKDCRSLRSVFPLDCLRHIQGITMILLPEFQRLEVVDSPNLTKIWTVDEGLSSVVQVELSALKQLTLYGLSNVEEIWHDDHPASSVGKLEILKVDGCRKLMKVIPPNLIPGLQKLRVLDIKDCSLLEFVCIPKENPSVLFPLLEKLTLTDLPKLKQLWWNISESFDLPNLCRLEVMKCNNLKTLFTPFAANRFINLRKLFIEDCSEMEAVLSREGEEECKTHIVFPLVDTLHLIKLPNLKHFYLGNYTLEWPKLEYVLISGCEDMESFSPGTLKMPNLKSIAQSSGAKPLLRISSST